jgi:transmembrane sensor
MPAPHPEDLLDQYLAGELTAAEAERVRAYFDAEPGRRATLAAVRATVRGAAYGAPPAVADAHADLLARIHAAERGSSLRRPGVTLPSRGRTAAWLGAGALGVAGFAAVWSAMFLGSGGPPTERQYTARPGQQTTVVLADGSRAQLAPSTTIRVQRDGDETRVAVDGQAFFTVQHRAGSAFVVRTDGLVARVLGTQFAVRQYRGEPLSRLVVAEGRVALSGPRGAAGTVVLAAGGVGVVTRRRPTIWRGRRDVSCSPSVRRTRS